MIEVIHYIGYHGIIVTIVLLQVNEILHFLFVPGELYLEMEFPC